MGNRFVQCLKEIDFHCHSCWLVPFSLWDYVLHHYKMYLLSRHILFDKCIYIYAQCQLLFVYAVRRYSIIS